MKFFMLGVGLVMASFVWAQSESEAPVISDPVKVELVLALLDAKDAEQMAQKYIEIAREKARSAEEKLGAACHNPDFVVARKDSAGGDMICVPKPKPAESTSAESKK